MMAGWRRSSAVASLQLPVVTVLLFIWVFRWGHATAYPDIANMTALQKHDSFFDRNKDGIITPSETFEGYVAIGCDVAFSRETASSLHTGIGPITSPVDAPLPHINIYIDLIHKAMYGSDTSAYDAKGRGGPVREWGLSYELASDKDGFLHKDSIRGIYDGSEFFKLEEKQRSYRSKM